MSTQPTSLPVPSESPRDLKFNAGKIDEFVTSLVNTYVDRFGKEHYTIEGLRWLAQQAIAQYGWILIDSFQDGADITLPNQALRDEDTGEYYRWDGALPKHVDAGSTPASSGGVGIGAWLSVGDSTLRSMLASSAGASNIGTYSGESVQDAIDTVKDFMINADAAYYSTRNISKLSYVDYQVHTRGSIKVCFQGDSMTAGFDQTSSDVVPPNHGDYATHASMTYPQRFTDFLSQQSGCTVIPTWRAYSGFTAKMAYEKPDWQTNPNVDLFILMYGLNDISLSTIDEYLDYMQRLIRRFINWGSGVIVCIPSNGGQGAKNPINSIWARRMKMVAQAYGCAVFDANEISYYRHNGAIQSDEGHFNSMGYAIHGEKLASMFMAGGILPTYRPLTNEITTWCGRVDNSVGYCDARGNVSLGRADGAYTRSKIIGSLPANVAALMSFSFYLDSDAAHIFIKGSGAFNIIMHNGKWWNNEAQDYYKYAIAQDISYAMQMQVTGDTGYNGLPGDFPAYQAERKFVGCIYGRGWHTVSIFNAQDGGQATASYVNGLIIQPIPAGYAVQKYNAYEEKRIKVVQSLKLPSPYGQASVPAAIALTGFYLKAPQSLMPTNTSVASSNNVTPFSYNSGQAFLRISSHAGDYIECLIIKTVSSGYNWTCKIINSTYAEGARPTITAALKKRNITILKEAGANGTSQPLEQIQNSDGTLVDPTSPSTKGGLYLQFALAWPGAAPSGYWNIELEASDLFASSEVALGR